MKSSSMMTWSQWFRSRCRWKSLEVAVEEVARRWPTCQPLAQITQQFWLRTRSSFVQAMVEWDTKGAPSTMHGCSILTMIDGRSCHVRETLPPLEVVTHHLQRTVASTCLVAGTANPSSMTFSCSMLRTRIGLTLTWRGVCHVGTWLYSSWKRFLPG